MHMKQMKKIALAIVVLLLFGMMSAGCGNQNKNLYTVYLINGSEDGLVEGTYNVKGEDADSIVQELTAILNSHNTSVGHFSHEGFSSESGDSSRMALLPDSVSIDQYSIENGNLSLWFSESYYDMNKKREILCRDGIVQEMLQIPEINSVVFYIGEDPLIGPDGEEVGLMTQDSFVTNPGSQINSVQEEKLTLYFADSTGTSLVTEVQNVNYISSVSIEKLIVQQLIGGPASDSLQATIAPETKILNVTVSNGICYVNFDSGFLTQGFSISPELTIYSIVNSLCQLDDVEGVHISVNGSSDVVFHDTISLDQTFTMNQDVVSADAEPIEREVKAN